MARETNLKPLAQISWWNPLLISEVEQQLVDCGQAPRRDPFYL